ncbi:MAG: hypothetical protein R3A52_03390 [Polyangiales bacterium]
MQSTHRPAARSQTCPGHMREEVHATAATQRFDAQTRPAPQVEAEAHSTHTPRARSHTDVGAAHCASAVQRVAASEIASTAGMSEVGASTRGASVTGTSAATSGAAGTSTLASGAGASTTTGASTETTSSAPRSPIAATSEAASGVLGGLMAVGEHATAARASEAKTRRMGDPGGGAREGGAATGRA